MLLLLFLWFCPYTHNFCVSVDENTFLFLNHYFLKTPELQAFFGMLNHRKETGYDLIFAAFFNIWAILQTREPHLRRERIWQTVYFWVCFEISYLLVDLIFVKGLQVVRLSPSIVMPSSIHLSEVLSDINVKDFSIHSFPGGHAFSLIYWASFTLLCAPKRIAYLGFFVASMLCIPRLVSGAHWLSDVIFSISLSFVWFRLTTQNAWYQKWFRDTSQLKWGPLYHSRSPI